MILLEQRFAVCMPLLVLLVFPDKGEDVRVLFSVVTYAIFVCHMLQRIMLETS